MTPSAKSPYAGYRFPGEVISHAVWLYFRFPLSLRMVEEMLAARGIAVSHETVRQWGRKFGQAFANQIRRRLPCPGDKWHLDEVCLMIGGKKHWLWRAVDQDGIVLGLSQSFGVYPTLSMQAAWVPPNRRWRMILNALVEKLKRRSKDDFKGRHYEATLILQAVSWYLRYPLSYRDIEELFLERGLEVDHSTLNRWVLAYAPLIERRLRTFRKPHCGSIRIDETYIKIRGQWRYLYRAIDKHGTPVDFLLTAQRDLEAAKRFFRKMLQDEPLLAPDRIGTDGAGLYPPAITAARKDGPAVGDKEDVIPHFPDGRHCRVPLTRFGLAEIVQTHPAPELVPVGSTAGSP